ncbi:voltage-dependent calcium channel subunit alpha-2/delta-3-like [Notothenia coriiceps]|uniref:Voltage-dependent calcium channel subunit alpha-2/delta-3-like n=1 Tax=Notothenia coriiceps TaxID=8208 RepID=A0A6I9PNN8_9TELE|nr:PREDICTED: voltage-dependent calcium channel subunit alpha-2/delta-3-like [Notothenia coriiceps]
MPTNSLCAHREGILPKMQVDRSCVVSSAWYACLILLFSTLGTRVSEVGGTHQSIPPSVVKLWASAFGGEIKSISAKYSGSQLLQKKYKEFERAVRVDEIDGLRLVKRLAEDMEEMFHKKAEAMKADSSTPARPQNEPSEVILDDPQRSSKDDFGQGVEPLKAGP